jgi:hypothetical protein
MKSCFPHDEFCARGFVPFQVRRDQAINHLAFSVSNFCNVGLSRASFSSKTSCMMNVMRNFGAPYLVLAGKAIDVRARASDPAPFDNCRFLPGLCQVPGKVFSALAAADDNVLVHFAVHIENLFYGELDRQCRLERASLTINRAPSQSD